MSVTKTPKAVTEQIRSFCREISPNAQPVLIAIKAEDDCQVNECFHNVRRKVDRFGGRIQFGWAIWEWAGAYIEAEHHAVYVGPNNSNLIDITPSADGKDNNRLFLTDDSAVYDFDNEGIRRDNIRHALVDDPLIERLFTVSAAITEIMNSVPGVGMVSVSGRDAQRLTALNMEKLKIGTEMGMKYTPQGAPCFCGSGIKFKRCHGQPRKKR